MISALQAAEIAKKKQVSQPPGYTGAQCVSLLA